MAGPKSKRTPENEAIILEAVRMGMSYNSACECAGIGKTMFMAWKAEDADFMNRIDCARRTGQMERLKRISRHASQDWRADAWLLSHSDPESFSEKRIIEHKGSVSPFDKLVEALDNIPDEGTEDEAE